MKRFLLVLVLFLLFFSASYSQTLPQGMKYQGVARDLKGNVMADQKITLRIALSSMKENKLNQYYVENHVMTTTQLGLFTLVVGEGSLVTGKFSAIPWSTEEIWMEVSIKDNTGFATISSSKLLAVPYAFHALTANEIVGGALGRTGIPSNTWSTFGNSRTNVNDDALGTTDQADLIIITNDIERIRVLKGGDVKVAKSLAVGENLSVNSNVELNVKNGSTINNGPFTVAKNSPTLLSGTLTVDLHTDLNASLNVNGPSDLQSKLTVHQKSPTQLSGTLNVDGITTIQNQFSVLKKSSSELTGTLKVDDNGTFKSAVILDNATLNQDTASRTLDGALRVSGGVGIGGNVAIGGSARIGGGLGLGSLKVSDPIQSTSTTTGAVVVVGGVGVGMQLNVAGNTTVGGSTTIGGATTINNSLDVNAGNSQVKIKGGTSTGDYDNENAYALLVEGKVNGMQVKINTQTANRSNNYITFRDGTKVRGRIEGQTINDFANDPWYTWDELVFTKKIAQSTVSAVVAAQDLFAHAADIRACVGLGACVTSPGPLVVAFKVIQLAVKVADVAINTYQLVDYKNKKENLLGVVYSSSAGDYAEWLPRDLSVGNLKPGQVVGVYKGQVTLNTAGADRVFVISTNPIVLGNAPADEQKGMFEKVAFLGQVPVRVLGAVSVGDYILASNKNDGFGIAKNPQDLTIDDLANFIGIAWTESNDVSEKPVKVAIGISNNDIKNIVAQIDRKVNKHNDELVGLKKQLSEHTALLQKLLNGEKVNQPLVVNELPKAMVIEAPVQSKGELIKTAKPSPVAIPAVAPFTVTNKVDKEIVDLLSFTITNSEGKRLPVLTDELVDKMLEWGMAYTGEGYDVVSKENGTKATLRAKIQADPTLKKAIYDNVKQLYQQAYEKSLIDLRK